MIVQKILRWGRRKKFNVLFDDGSSISLSEEILFKFGFIKGKEFSESELEKILHTELRYQAKQMAINFLSYRPRSRYEVAKKLRQEKIPSDVVEETISGLTRSALLDDYDFARRYARDLVLKKPIGILRLKNKLYEKGINRQIIDEILKEHNSKESQISAAKEVLKRKVKLSANALEKLDVIKRKKRLFDFLLRRGFSTDIAKETLRIFED